GLAALAAAGPVPLEREHLVGQLDEATHAAEVLREDHEVRHRAPAIEEAVADAGADLRPPEAARVDHLLRVPGQEEPGQRAPRHETEQQLHLDLGEILGLVTDQMVVESAGRDGGQGEPAEIDLVQAAPSLEMLLPAAGHVVEPAPLADERGRALATEGLVLLVRKQWAGQVEARALDDAPDLLPGEGGIGAPELSLVPSRELGVGHDRTEQGA